MPNTLPDSIYYPDDNTMVDDLAGIFASQATSVQAALSNLRTALAPTPVTDTGWTLAGITPATNFSGIADSMGNSTGLKGGLRKVGNLVELRFRVTRSGATLSAGSNGNVADTLVATITNSALRPSGIVYNLFDIGPGTGSGGARVEPDGSVKIIDAYPNRQIPSGTVLQFQFMYFTG